MKCEEEEEEMAPKQGKTKPHKAKGEKKKKEEKGNCAIFLLYLFFSLINYLNLKKKNSWICPPFFFK